MTAALAEKSGRRDETYAAELQKQDTEIRRHKSVASDLRKVNTGLIRENGRMADELKTLGAVIKKLRAKINAMTKTQPTNPKKRKGVGDKVIQRCESVLL